MVMSHFGTLYSVSIKELQQRSRAIFSFQIMNSHEQYSVEKLAGDCLLGSEFVEPIK